jgi:hypothetical protein
MTHAIEHPIALGTAMGSRAARIPSRVAFWLLAGSFSASALLGQCLPNNLTFTNQSVASGTYQAVDSITADAGNGSGTTVINSGASVAFQAGNSITLLPSFHAAPGSSFQASIANAAALAIAPTAVSLLGGGGLECATVTISSGASWSASSNAAWITFPAGSTGIGSGTLVYQVAQNPSGTTSLTGAITVTSAGGSATLTVSEAALASGGPTTALLNQLNNGSLPSQATQVLTVTAGSPNGPGYLSSLSIVVDFVDGTPYSCQMYYFPQSNVFYFANQGNETAYTLGTPGQQATGVHCNLNVANSSVTLNPSSATASVTLNLALTLQPSAVGTQKVYMQVSDNSSANNSNYWNSMASWTAFGLPTTNPPAVSMASAPATGPSQALHYEISDGNGYTFIGGTGGQLAHDTSETNSPCFFNFYLPNMVALFQIANGTYTLLGEGYIGGSWSYPSTNGIIGGSGGLAGPGTCSIDLNQSSVSTGTDGTGTLQNPNAGTPWQPVTRLYLDLWTGLDGTAQGTLPLNIYFWAWDLLGNGPANVDVGTWSAQASPLTIATSSLPVGAVGAAYSVGLTAAGGSGGYTWSIASGSLPAGLQLSSGAITGTPTAAGSYRFCVEVTAGSSAATQWLTLTVNGAPLTVTTTWLPAGVVGTWYLAGLAATGGSGGYTWSLASGTLPAGMAISMGTINGAPSASGSYTFTVEVTDSSSASATRSLTLIVSSPSPTLTVATSSLPTGVVGAPYTASLAATGGSGGYTWSLAAGTTLPPGLGLSSGAIIGTPGAVGSFSFTVQVTDSSSTTAAGSLTLTVNSPGLTITGSLPTGVVGVAYAASLTANGGTPGYTWSLAQGTTLPAGLSFSAGTFSGTPTAAGSSSITVKVTDSRAATASQNFTLATVSPMQRTAQPDLGRGAPSYCSNTARAILNNGTAQSLAYCLGYFDYSGNFVCDNTYTDAANVSNLSVSGSGVTASFAGSPSQCAPGQPSTFDVSYTAPNTAPGSYDLTFLYADAWRGTQYPLTVSDALKVYDTTPVITSVYPDQPIVAGGQAYVTLYGSHFGSSGSVQVCTNSSGTCSPAQGFSASLNAPYSCYGSAPLPAGCGSDGQINVLLTSPSNSAGGTFYFQVTVSTDVTGAQFLPSSSETSGNNSNMESFEVEAVAMQLTQVGATVINPANNYSEDTTIQVTAVDATTGATLTNFTGTVNIAEAPAADGTTIYSQNGGSLVTAGGQPVVPATVNITAGGTATFVAQSLAGPSVAGLNGSKPNDAVIQTTNYPLWQNQQLAVPQWIISGAQIDPHASGQVYDWFQTRARDVFNAAAGDLATVLASVKNYSMNGALGGCQTTQMRARQSSFACNPYYTEKRIGGDGGVVCASPRPNALNASIYHEARHGYQGWLSSMPGNDVDGDWLVENIPIAPTTGFVDSTAPRLVCKLYHLPRVHADPCLPGRHGL